MKARKTIFIALIAILFTGIMIVPAMGLQISSQDRSIRTDAFENTAVQHIAQKHNIPIEQLDVICKTEAHYRMIDKKLWCMKISDNKSHEIYAISMDMDGNIVDVSEIEKQEHREYAEKYGKLEPVLYDRLQGASGGELMKVGIWLREIDSERIEKDVLSKIDVDKLTDRNAARTDIFAAKKEAYALNEKPVINYLNANGFEINYASFSAPLIFVELTKEEIIALEGRDDVDRIFLSKIYEPGTDTAVPTIKAPYVWKKGYDGSGTKVAIVEVDGVDFANPYLRGIMRRPAQDDIGGHATVCAGMVASTHPTYKGVANGTTILSANADSWDCSDLVEASDWALDNDADILSCSFCCETDLQLDEGARYYDHVIWEHHRAVTVCAGNNNGNVTSPGIAYNVITVGGTDDMDTPDWGDDERYLSSSYKDPISPNGDQDKPEVSAVARRILSTKTEDYFKEYGVWIAKPINKTEGTSLAAPAVAGIIATLIEKDSSLRGYPEVSKAMIMASAVHDTYDGGTSHPYYAIDDKEGTGTVVASEAYRIVDNDWKQGFNHLIQNDFTMEIEFDAVDGEEVRFVICWDYHTKWDVNRSYDVLLADLDLRIISPSGSYIDGSCTYDRNFEVVDFIARESGEYKAYINACKFDAGYERLGVAWWRCETV